jgi:mono/diheme cytochrome c family protein/ketosteroid isomerase-like protein
MKTWFALLVVLLLLVIGGAAFVVSGVYDIGADAPHWPLTERAIGVLRDSSVHARADAIEVPDLDDAEMIAEGAEHYAAMCTGCHLAPGMSESEIRPGLYPTPPVLAEERDLQPAEAFWVIKHGIKMSAMPAWGTTHTDEAIWNMVAFLRKLPAMTPDEYRQLTGGENGDAGHEHGHDHHDHGGAKDAKHEHGSDADADHAQEHAAAATQSAGAAPEAESVVQAFHAALARGDRAAVLALLTEDARISEDGQTQDRATYAAAHLAADIAFLKEAKVTLLSRVSALAGERAQVASASTVRATVRGKPVALRSDESMELRRVGADWRIAAIRWTSEPEPARP